MRSLADQVAVEQRLDREDVSATIGDQILPIPNLSAAAANHPQAIGVVGIVAERGLTVLVIPGVRGARRLRLAPRDCRRRRSYNSCAWRLARTSLADYPRRTS